MESRPVPHPLDPVKDGMPLDKKTRLLCLIDGDRYADIDPKTGVCVRIGKVRHDTH